MNVTGSTSTRSLTTIRWAARIIAILFIAVFLVFFTADCVKKGTIAIESDRLVMTAFMFLAFIGLIIAWKREGIGAAWTLAGLIGVNIFAPTTLAEAGVLVITVMYGLPALLFLYCWWQTRRQIRPKTT
jgi:hypothetical protein